MRKILGTMHSFIPDQQKQVRSVKFKIVNIEE